MTTPRFTIVGIGEALFDVFPDAQVLGGAPLNVAVHAHQLAQARGGRGVVVSRVGQDDLGEQVLADLQRRGMATDYVQTDPDHSTGQVFIEFDDKGNPSYQIAADAAWDWLQWDPELEDLAKRCDAVCFGSLAQRDGQSRNLIYRFLDEAKRAFKLFDVNLRKPFDRDQSIIRRSCERADAVKLNDQELPLIAGMLGLEGRSPDEQAGTLLQRFKLKRVILTRGAQGTVVFSSTGRFEGEPVSYPAAPGADAVGAGDACSAGLLVGTVLRLPVEKVLALANHAGAFVASQPGATPTLPGAILDMAR